MTQTKRKKPINRNPLRHLLLRETYARIPAASETHLLTLPALYAVLAEAQKTADAPEDLQTLRAIISTNAKELADSRDTFCDLTVDNGFNAIEVELWRIARFNEAGQRFNGTCTMTTGKTNFATGVIDRTVIFNYE